MQRSRLFSCLPSSLLLLFLMCVAAHVTCKNQKRNLLCAIALRLNYIIFLRSKHDIDIDIAPIITDTRSRLLAHYVQFVASCTWPYVVPMRTQPLTATGAPSQTSTIPYHAPQPYHLPGRNPQKKGGRGTDVLDVFWGDSANSIPKKGGRGTVCPGRRGMAGGCGWGVELMIDGLAARICCTFSPTTFSSVQFSSGLDRTAMRMH